MIKTLMKNIFTPLLKRIQALEYSLGLIADYVVETGTDGIWTYEKWESGKAKCWGNKDFTVNVSQAWGSGYTSSGGVVADFPTGLFSEPPTYCNAQTMGGVGSYMISNLSSNYATTTRTPEYHAIRFTTYTTLPITVGFEAIGTWK